MWKQVFVQKYTKSFGGKIWKNLHRVSPYTIFGKKNLQDFILKLFSRQNIHYHIKQKFSNLPNIASWSKVTTIEILLEMLYMACSCKRQHEKLSLEFGQTFDLKFFCLFSRGQTVFNFYKFYDGKLSLISRILMEKYEWFSMLPFKTRLLLTFYDLLLFHRKIIKGKNFLQISFLFQRIRSPWFGFYLDLLVYKCSRHEFSFLLSNFQSVSLFFFLRFLNVFDNFCPFNLLVKQQSLTLQLVIKILPPKLFKFIVP